MILWFAASIAPASRGGVHRVMEEFAGGLRSRGHAAVCMYSPGSLRHSYVAFSVMLAFKLLTTPKHRKPDIILARSSDGLCSSVAVRLLRLRTKVILHNHGWEQNAYAVESRLPRLRITHPTTWKAHVIRFPLVRLACRLSHGTLHGTVYEARSTTRICKVAGKRVLYVPNGVKTNRNIWNRAFPARPDFLCVANNTWKKNLDYVIDTFRQITSCIPQSRLFLVGTGTESITGVSGQGPIINIPSENPDRMGDWYAKCPFLISGSRYEGGHSLAILEAMSWGCVCFVSAIPSTCEFVLHNRNGILLEGIDSLADAQTIVETLEDANVLSRLSSRGFQTALRNRWGRQIDRLEKALWKIR